MTENMIFVARCPMGLDEWHSEPMITQPVALEAQRAHVNGHAHGDLVDWITRDHGTMSMDVYEKK